MGWVQDDAEINFYCEVLPHALKTCDASKDRKSHKMSPSFPSNMNHRKGKNKYSPGLEPSRVYEEIVLSAHGRGKLKSKIPLVPKQISLWMDMIAQSLEDKDLGISDLPIECLYPFESKLLLQVSLEYEKDLVPEFFSSNGSNGLEREFKKWKFCSVDTLEIFRDKQWDFLFDNEALLL